MPRRLLPFLLAGLLTACGLDAASSAATAAKLKAREAEQAQTLKQNIEQQLDAARQQEEQRRKDAEAASR